ncbi:glycosyltransferase [Granulicella cerasi]|uniref:Glycosyltransferase n=1 Tax=Granulicella cerasi TaxID=741063 RepID=A0ABW1Z981_9BACT|nr:glycosyltransferase [Granulicella cerasi]
MKRLCIITPVFNDWTSFRILLGKLNAVAAEQGLSLEVKAVDDGSSDPITPLLEQMPELRALAGVEVIHLGVNIGHQRAIAVGLCAAAEEEGIDAVVVMDADGEDPPEAIPTLLAAVQDPEHFCVVAQRRRRTETFTFRASYVMYRLLFFIVTGKKISFGNFSAMSIAQARRLTLVSELWNHLPSAVLRSRIPITQVPVDRGYRYDGRSKMNFVSLIVHGLSGISVYADAIFVRLLLFSVLFAAATAVAILIVTALRFFVPQHATPGWATEVSFSMVIILSQVGLTALSSILMLLNSRVQRQVLPKFEYKPYILSRRQLWPR